MQVKFIITIFLILFLAAFLTVAKSVKVENEKKEIVIGAKRFKEYLPLIQNRSVGLAINHTSIVDSIHLVDALLARDVKIKAIYAPEHGYKGKVERGASIENQVDTVTGIPVISIYGNKRKPSKQDLKDIEVMIFDMQDIGVRFFTYISTLHYVMEACAENNIELIVLDRPNPLGYYVDGPLLDTAYRSFIGMHPVPIVHGLTIGEYALMINGEGWLKDSVRCNLHVVEVKNYDHSRKYILSTPPSPNLPDMKSIYLYPSICLFEGAEVNEGRGTDKPFQQFGTPTYQPKKNCYTPVSIPGYSLNPKFEGQTCCGYDLSNKGVNELQNITRIELKYLIEFYNKAEDKDKFFNPEFFDLLVGGEDLRSQIISGKSEREIRKSWLPGLADFKKLRSKYLLYN